MKHIKKFNNINEGHLEDGNKESFKMYKKSISDLVDYIKNNDVEKDAENFLEKNINMRCTPMFSMGSNNIDKILKELKNLKK